MLYKPKFCCECGIKIERENWKPWTNRRFCENCEIEKREYVIFPKVIAGFLALLGIFSIGGFLQKSEPPLKITKPQFVSSETSANRQISANTSLQTTLPAQNPTNSTQPTKKIEPKTAESLRLESKTVLEESPDKLTESVYFCGAKTKKGTACTRRVKGGGRCWQHIGQSAVFSDEKLSIRQ